MRFNLAVNLVLFFKDREAAIEALESALAKGGPNVVTLIANDPNLDSIRDDPRFQQMLSLAKERVGLVTAPAASNPTPAA
jgi:hypothetical protein